MAPLSMPMLQVFVYLLAKPSVSAGGTDGTRGFWVKTGEGVGGGGKFGPAIFPFLFLFDDDSVKEF